MRRSFRQEWLKDESGAVIGINMGSDHCAEHEEGIKKLQEALNCRRETEYGIDRRRIQPVSELIALVKKGDSLSLLVSSDDYEVHRRVESLKKKGKETGESAFYSDKDMVTTWDEGSFLIRVKGKENTQHLQEIYDALMAGNTALWIGGGGPFGGQGLCLAIIDKIPAENKKMMEDGDRDREKLHKAAEATGIKARIDKLNKSGNAFYPPCGYYALSPRWKCENDTRTKYDVMFWLNPMEQKKNNFGWFTVEELELWLEGKGPISNRTKE